MKSSHNGKLQRGKSLLINPKVSQVKFFICWLCGEQSFSSHNFPNFLLWASRPSQEASIPRICFLKFPSPQKKIKYDENYPACGFSGVSALWFHPTSITLSRFFVECWMWREWIHKDGNINIFAISPPSYNLQRKMRNELSHKKFCDIVEVVTRRR